MIGFVAFAEEQKNIFKNLNIFCIRNTKRTNRLSLVYDWNEIKLFFLLVKKAIL